jgi:hypothetical protein
MTIPFDIFRMEAKGVLWVESAPTLDHAKSRVEELAKCAPGEYLLLNHANGEKVVIKAFGLDEALSNQGKEQSVDATDVQKGTKFSQAMGV